MFIEDLLGPGVEATTLEARYGLTAATPRLLFVGKSRLYGLPGWSRKLMLVALLPLVLTIGAVLGRESGIPAVGLAVPACVALAGIVLAIVPATLEVSWDAVCVRWLGLTRTMSLDEVSVEPAHQNELTRHLTMQSFAAVRLRTLGGRAVTIRFGKLAHELAHHDAFVDLVLAIQAARRQQAQHAMGRSARETTVAPCWDRRK